MEKRYGGGGAVVLHPGCVVLSLGIWVKDYYQNQRYFCALNKAVIKHLASFWPSLGELQQNGISDIAYRGKKIAGTSLFRSRNYLLYQASILIEDRLDLIDRYLKHPSREPEYRQGKSHRQFLSCLNQILDHPVETKEVARSLLNDFDQYLPKDEIISPVEKQKAHLLKKINTTGVAWVEL